MSRWSGGVLASKWFQHVEAGPFLSRHLLTYGPGARSQGRLFTFLVARSLLYTPGLGQRGEVSGHSARERTASQIQPLHLLATTQGLLWEQENFPADFFNPPAPCLASVAWEVWGSRLRCPGGLRLRHHRNLASASTRGEIFPRSPL